MKVFMLKLLPICLASLALMVVFGWIASLPAIVQIHPEFAPMQFNTALCFLLLSLSFFGDLQRLSFWRFIAMLLCFLLSVATLIQFIFEINLGIDGLIGNLSITTKTAYPGRMSRATSLAFAILSITYFLTLSRSSITRRLVYLLVSASVYLVFIIAIINLGVYFIATGSTGHWEVHTGMGLHTSLLMGILALIAYYRNYTFGYNRHEFWAPHNALLVLLIGCLCSIAIWRHTISYETDVLVEKLVQDSRLRATVIQRQFEEDVAKIQATERFFSSSSFVTSMEFRNFVHPLVEEDRSILAIDWSPRIATNDLAAFEQGLRKRHDVVVRQLNVDKVLTPHMGADVYYPVLYTFPDKFSERVIGYDHYSDSLRTRTMDRAARENSIITSEPFHLFRLSQEIRLPANIIVVIPVVLPGDTSHVIIDAKSPVIKGFIIGVFHLPDVINEALNGLGLNGLGVELSAEFDEGLLKTVYKHSVPKSSLFEGSFLPEIHRFPPTQTVLGSFGSRKFVFTFKASSLYVEENINRLSSVIFLACLFITYLTALFLASIQIKQEELLIQKDSLSIALFEKQTALQNLQESEALFRELSDSAPIGIFQLDSSGLLQYVNRAWQEISGIALAQSKNTEWFKAIHDEDRAKAQVAIQNGVGSKRMVTEKFRFVHENGSIHWVVCNLSPIHLGDGTLTGFVGSTFDITEVQRLIEHLRIATAAKSEFLANMSHELRTPMNSIIGFTQLMLRSKKVSLPDRHRDALETIQKNGRHLLRLVNEILDLSKVESGEMKLRRSMFDLPVLIREVVAALSPQAEAKNLTVRFDTDIDTFKAYADETKFRQIFTNLLSNGIRYTDKGEVTVHLMQDDSIINISVRDTGIGIAKKEQQKLFRSFTQLEGAGHRREGGTGLGLSIAKNFIELHGGSISVESEPGKGTTFTASFPITNLTENLEDSTSDSES